MKEQQEKRLFELLDQGRRIVESVKTLSSMGTSCFNTRWGKQSPEYLEFQRRESARHSLKDSIEAEGKSWFYSSAKTIGDFVTKSSFYWEECEKLRARFSDSSTFSHDVYRSMYDLLVSIHSELERGLLDDPEYLFAAETFSDFLEHAEVFLSEDKIRESSVLGSAVFEDAMKKIAKKNALENTTDKGVEELINALKSKGILRSVKAKKLKACAGIRKHAFHAEWKEIVADDVRLLITETKDLLDSYL